MARSLILCAALALAACKPSGDDGYRYKGAELARDKVTITLVRYPDEKALQRAAARQNIAFGDSLHEGQGFGRVETASAACTIHVVAPDRQRMWLGHEALHCFDGRWHD